MLSTDILKSVNVNKISKSTDSLVKSTYLENIESEEIKLNEIPRKIEKHKQEILKIPLPRKTTDLIAVSPRRLKKESKL